MSISIETSGAIQSSVNGNIITDAAFDSHYDGETLKIKGFSDGVQSYMELDNAAIQKILSMPSHHASLEERIMSDYGSHSKKHTKKHNKKHNKKSSSAKKTRRNRSTSKK